MTAPLSPPPTASPPAALPGEPRSFSIPELELADPVPATLQRAFWRVSVSAQVGGLVLCVLFFNLILGLSVPRLLWLAPPLGGILAVLALGWGLALRRLFRPLRLLGPAPPAGPDEQPQPGRRTRLEAAYRAAHELPYRAALIGEACWLLGMAGLGGVGAWRPAADETGLGWPGMVLGAFVISFGAIIYQTIGQQLVLRPALERLSILLVSGGRVRPGDSGSGLPASVGAAAVRVRYSLRFKMTFSFTALVFFACSFALFLSFVQSHELIDRLHGAGSRERVRLLATLVHLDEPVPLGEREGLALVSPTGEVLRRWGTLPADDALLRQLAAAGAPSALLTPRGLVGAVAEAGTGPHSPRGGQLVLVVPRPRQGTRHLQLMILFMSLMFLGSSGLVHLFSGEVTGPIQTLSERAREMASGRLDRPVPVGEADELGVLAGAFDTMRTSLRDKLATIEELNTTLEQKVLTRTRELEQALDQLQASEAKLVQSEKLASLGQLVAGVAHEINNPVNFVLNTLEPLQELVGDLVEALDRFRAGASSEGERLVRERGLQDAGPDVLRMLEVMRNGAERTRRIVADLRSFSRLDEAELKVVRLEDGLRSTLNLLRPSIPPGVRIQTHFELGEPVLCYAGQLNQVFMNLLTNAVQAVGDQGQVVVRSRREEEWAVVEVSDDGPGIPAALRHRIFDPFFTTKEVGQGTGLGLSISLGVVARHGGELRCTSEEGQGASFTVRIPLGGPPRA